MAKKVFEIDEDEVNQKAKDIFEDAVQTETSMYKGKLASDSVDLKDLLDFGLTPPVLVKLGKAGIEIGPLKAVCKKKKKDAVSELQGTLEELSGKEAKKIYHAVRKVRRHE